MKRLIGIWGYPAPDVLEKVKANYPDNELIDLDVNINAPALGVLPDAYCRIMRNIIDNSLFLRDRLDVIVASVGREKCDSGWFAAKILKDMEFNIIETKYEEYSQTLNTPISKSNLPLNQKITAIMDGILNKAQNTIHETKPEYGFWGVPPNDLDFLDIFPDTTHVYGWTRCVEAGKPADIDLEMYVNENVPTVFFAQTFCAKMQLAKYLAKKHSGLYVDVDDTASNSVLAKIEAFIKLG
ncbi:MAG: hypothetical protein A2Y25_09570 [Candidatus Melainabacteria bacterium GWF2_37_15]|nr:MAG: hypothetical protein A2Y25_09570 [Candidatus Melainabacteria bacterium GWF2_37_15]